MGIDGIGKPGAPGIGGPGSVKPPAEAGESFKVERTAGAEPATASEALAGLERGELSLDQYLDVRSAEAVRHLDGKLSNEQLEFVKQTLREQLASDPVLVELVRRTTGQV
jgi:hypothetical protein